MGLLFLLVLCAAVLPAAFVSQKWDRAGLAAAFAALALYGFYESRVPRGTNIRVDLVLAIPFFFTVLVAAAIACWRLARKRP